MPRRIEFGTEELVVHLTGLVHYESLTTDLHIPYRSIVRASAEPFVPPLGTIRWFGTHVPFTDIREGRFSHEGAWYFFSVEDRRKAVTLWLEGYSHGDAKEPLKVVVLGTPEPEALLKEVEQHRSRSGPPPPA